MKNCTKIPLQSRVLPADGTLKKPALVLTILTAGSMVSLDLKSFLSPGSILVNSGFGFGFFYMLEDICLKTPCKCSSPAKKGGNTFPLLVSMI